MTMSQTQVKEVSTTGALAFAESFASQTALDISKSSDEMVKNISNAMIREGYSNDIVKAIKNPEVQASIEKSIQGLQAQIQGSIDYHASETDTKVRAANIASDISKMVGKGAGLLAINELFNASNSGSSQTIGNVLVGMIMGAAAAMAGGAFIGLGGLVGIPAIGIFVGAAVAGYYVAEFVVPDQFKEGLGELFKDSSHLLFDDFFDALEPHNIPSNINDLWAQAQNWFQTYTDPLALDLDGDGIETIGADGTVVFDHNANNIKTGTGWVSADDGLLVLDRDGNGAIDNGSELFGVDTVKADGTKATDGFDALSDLDSNNDGVFDALDTEFANVRVWQDLNQDGVSDDGELQSLTEAGIVSINLNADSNATNLANGNVQTATSTFTKTNGETGTVGNLDLVSNAFYSEFTDTIPLSDEALTLPDAKGAGMVRDLREAMSLSSELTALVNAFANEESYVSQHDQIDTLVDAWAETSTMQSGVGDDFFHKNLLRVAA